MFQRLLIFLVFFEFFSFVCRLFLVYSICFHLGGPSDDLEGALEVLGGSFRHPWRCLGDACAKLEGPGGALDTIFSDPNGSARCKSSYIPYVF